MSTEEHKSVISVDVNRLLSPVSQAIKKIDDLTGSLKKLNGLGKMSDAVKGATDTAQSMNKAFTAVKKCSDAFENVRKKAQSASDRIRMLTSNLVGLKNTSSSTGMAVKSLAATLGRIVSIAAIVTSIKAAISAGQSSVADAAQFSQVFGSLEADAQKALEKIADEAGSTAFAMRSSFSSIGAYAKVTGMNTADALSLSERAMRAAADSAAFYDRKLEDVVESLRSYLKGNYENDAALGLASTETTRNAMAMQLYGQEFKNLTEAQKEWTLLAQIEEANRLSGALGQASRESGNWSTQIQLLQSRFKELTSIIGSGFIRALTPVLQTLNTILGALVDFANAASNVFANLFGTTSQQMSASLADVAIPDTGIEDLSDALGSASDNSKNLADGTKKAADAQKALNAQLMGFDKINKLSAQKAPTTSNKSAGASGNKGSGSGLGVATSAANAAGQSMVAQASKAMTDLEKAIKKAFDAADFTDFGAKVGQKIKDSLDTLNSKWPGIQNVVAKIAKSLATFLNGAIEVEGLGSSIGTTLGQAANTGFIAFNTFVGNFHWNSLGFLISNGIYNALVAFDWGQLTRAWTEIVAAKNFFVAGFIEGINWRALPGDLFDAVKEALGGIQWGKLLGSTSELAGAIAGAGAGLLVGLFETITNGADRAVTALFDSIGTFFTNAFKGAGENPTLLDVGKNIVVGIFNGIKNWLTGVGSWLKTNLLDPFITGFKNAFGIHSPASNPELLTAAGYVGQGILNGIAAPFKAIVGWVKTNILEPIQNAIKAPGNALSVGISLVKQGWSTVAGWIGNIPGVSQAVGLLKQGWSTIAGWIGNIPGVSQAVGLLKQGWSTIAGWIGNIPGVSQAVGLLKQGWSTIAGWIGNIPGVSQAVGLLKQGWSTIAGWIGNIPGVSQAVGLLKQGWSTIAGWIGNIPGVSQAVGLLKQGWSTIAGWIGNIPGVSQAVGLLKQGWSTIAGWIGNIPGVSQAVGLLKQGWSSVKGWIGTLSSISQNVGLAKSGWSTVSGWIGTLSKISQNVGLAKSGWTSVSGWIGTIKAVSATVNLAKGWSGTVASALGLTNLSSKFTIKLPTVSVSWSNDTIPLPKFSVKWNARGAILNGAQLFGVAGNTLLGGGEAGREAVLPLDRNTEWMDQLADKVAGRVGGGSAQVGQGRPIVVQVVLDGRVVGQTVVDYIHAQGDVGNYPLSGYV